MIDCNSIQILLNSFLQLTPWVQVILGTIMSVSLTAIGYFIKEVLAIIICSIVEWKHGYEHL